MAKCIHGLCTPDVNISYSHTIWDFCLFPTALALHLKFQESCLALDQTSKQAIEYLYVYVCNVDFDMAMLEPATILAHITN